MKKIITAFVIILVGLKSQAQVDSSTLTITVKLPVKAIVLMADYLSQNPNWIDRKLPDQMQVVIGTGNDLDSVVNITTTTARVYSLIISLLRNKNGVISSAARSILNNSPSITGYTALTSQITTIANGNTSQKAAAVYLIRLYTTDTNTDLIEYNSKIANGLNWIRN